VVDVIGRHPNLFWYRSSGMRKVLRLVSPEIVDLHEEPFGLAVAAALTAIRREAPRARICIYTAQNLPKRYPPPFSWLERRALGAADAAYPCSSAAGERLVARGFRGSVHVLPLGVTIPPARNRTDATVRVGFIGRLEPYKGGMIAVRAFVKAVQEGTASLEVIGGGSEEQALRREVNAAGLTERVLFAGVLSQEDALQRIASLDIVLVPSLSTRRWKEQFGRVAAQAMAAGAVVIASDSGSLREVVADGGILVPEGNVEGFARALRRMLDEPASMAALGAKARARAAAHFSWEAVAEGVEEMYRQVLTGRGYAPR
jgi:glycosyltransferase involved in cell wall biosynthesis